MSNSQSMPTLALSELAHVAGGASQAELRQLAQQYCPATYQRFQSARTITRPMAETCLQEAGLGMFSSRLDAYFPPRK